MREPLLDPTPVNSFLILCRWGGCLYRFPSPYNAPFLPLAEKTKWVSLEIVFALFHMVI